MVGRLADLMVDWMVAWMVDYWVAWMVDEMVGQKADSLDVHLVLLTVDLLVVSMVECLD